MTFLNWLTDKLQIKVLIAMMVLAIVAIYCIYHAVTTEGSAEVLIPVATFALGAMSGIAKDLLAPAPGDSEGYRIAMAWMKEKSDG